MSEKQKVLVNFIQDRSGSMEDNWKETLNGFKVFVEKLQQDETVDYKFSLTTFDTLVETPVEVKPIAHVDPLELRLHGPRGGTALYDAVGMTIEATDRNRAGAEKIICVIVTDGFENSSREWTKDRLNKAIDEKLKAGDWTFTYLGTQPETWADAAAIGLTRGATAGFQPGMAAAMYATVADSVGNLSRSVHTSSSSLFTSRHANLADMTVAGMTVKADESGVRILTPASPIPVPFVNTPAPCGQGIPADKVGPPKRKYAKSTDVGIPPGVPRQWR
jgi:hypothetical protein